MDEIETNYIQINYIQQIDCLDGLKTLPSNSIDLVVTSPPDNLKVEYENYKDSLPWNEYYQWCLQWLNVQGNRNKTK